MGMDATVTIWVGVAASPARKLPLPVDLLDQLESKGEVAYEGLRFKTFFSGDECCGFGTCIYYHDWDIGPVEFMVKEVEARIQKTIPIVARGFTEWGLDNPKVYINTDFS